MKIEHYTAAFQNGREDRYSYLRNAFPDIFNNSKSILDVGCDNNYLKSIYKDKVFGIDIGGTPDQIVDLEKEALRMFKDNSFEFIICTEVLEHIDNLHEVFDEIVRVSSKYILISLPNCSSTNRMLNLLKKGRNKKFYGLPFNKPVDRHKWFFSYKEIADFFVQQTKIKPLSIEKLIFHYGIRYLNETRFLHRIKQALMSWFVVTVGWHNQCQDVIVLFEKK